ncbi:M23 family metallopeptidase [Streptomyces sp. NPDC012888]|uniref:M23 family metallopeptidase n=1 Tax=Streptomyces sp. NPDC012888 TaxID=3364855 RepID=UPI0036954822
MSITVARRALTSVAALALTASGLVALAASPSYAAGPAYQMPFSCGQSWFGTTRSGHSPSELAIDWTRSAGTVNQPVLASAEGTVTIATALTNPDGSYRSYGKYVVIDHGGGWKTLYAHLNGFNVTAGTRVARGQQIGIVGNTGNSTGAHLHYEQQYGGSVSRSVFDGTPFTMGSTLASQNCGDDGGDVPVAGNWDGGKAGNVGIWRDGMFHLRNDDGSTTYVDWGGGSDVPVSANWDGAGPDNVGIFRPSTGQFHLRMDDGSLVLLDWGGGSDIPVAGNWDGGAAGNVGIWRNGTFHLRNDDGSPTYVEWGQAGDRPVSGNWDGAGPDNVGIFRPSTGQFHLRMDDGSLVVLDWGGGNDIPVSGNWDGGNDNPAANIGIWRPSQARFHLRNDDGTPTYIDWGQPR